MISMIEPPASTPSELAFKKSRDLPNLPWSM
jgi:hypothetical protein